MVPAKERRAAIIALHQNVLTFKEIAAKNIAPERNVYRIIKNFKERVNEYLFMAQARGIQIRENVRNMGAQVLEQMVRTAYNINGTDYPYEFNFNETDVPTTPYLPDGFTYKPDQVCPKKLPSMKGRLKVNMSEIALSDVEKLLKQADPSLSLGGHWKPHDCLPRWKAGNEPFNRAMLFNVGFKEAMKDLNWDCLIFHDVDHILENDRNYYGCGEMPRHFAVKLNKYSYMLPYEEFFGGVSGMTVEQFQKINGFPNAFWGWGGEDDDLWNRVQFAGHKVSRPHGELGRYMSIPHHHRGEVQFLGRYKLLRRSKERQSLDGLNNLNYSPLVSRKNLYTNVSVTLSRDLAPIADY
ncbi:Beta-1,4-galactosyltransferase 5 [Anabarilius grahami]|uniref:Beta-1,4-galactosyltransferase n=1 Tax=Anabarilius grahami TaxID=495550 RepID=A0A3N0YG74_ANAGA|nr:Beta-1,4-galactosyltransferase 5 [Anabarilius grahami]